jgi:hypothetical protein
MQTTTTARSKIRNLAIRNSFGLFANKGNLIAQRLYITLCEFY